MKQVISSEAKMPVKAPAPPSPHRPTEEGILIDSLSPPPTQPQPQPPDSNFQLEASLPAGSLPPPLIPEPALSAPSSPPPPAHFEPDFGFFELEVAQLSAQLAHSKSEYAEALSNWQTERDNFQATLKEKEHEVCSLREQLESQQRDRKLADGLLLDQIKASEQLIDKLSMDLTEIDGQLATKIGANLELTDHIHGLEASLSQAREERLRLESELNDERARCKRKMASLKEEMENGFGSKNGKGKSKKPKRDLFHHPTTSSQSSSHSPPPSPSSASVASSNRILLIGAGGLESDDGGVQAEIASLSKDEMRKRLKVTKYPQISVFHSFDSYVSALVSQIETLQSQGVDDCEIAIHLNDDLMAGVLGPGYAVHSRKMESISLDGVLEAVKACDKESSLLTGSEKFHAIVQGQGESRFSLMKRLENAFFDYQIGDPSDHRAKLRIIKKQFCIAASLPQQVIDNVRHCQDLDDVVICANEDLAKM